MKEGYSHLKFFVVLGAKYLKYYAKFFNYIIKSLNYTEKLKNCMAKHTINKQTCRIAHKSFKYKSNVQLTLSIWHI